MTEELRTPSTTTYPGATIYPGPIEAVSPYAYPNEPLATVLGNRLRERTQPLAPDDDEYGYAHAWLCESIMSMLGEVQAITDPEGDVPPLAPLLSPALCPAWALPWLAQFVGVALPDGVTADQARTLITDAAGFRRGTTASIKAAAGLFLTGDKTVYFREREDGDPYKLEIVTLTSETPDPAATERAIRAAKPAGIILTYRTVAGWDYEAHTAVGDTYAEDTVKYATYRDRSYNTPI